MSVGPQVNPVLFLDVDGVLNRHEFNEESLSNGFCEDCVERLNLVIDATGCDVVLSSAWRYMVLGGAMTLLGFSYLLRTHGVTAKVNVIGTTGKDAQDDRSLEAGLSCVGERGRQIHAWLEEHPEVTRYAVVDDMPIENDDFAGLPIVRLDGEVGLTDAMTDLLISELRVIRRVAVA